MATRAPSRIPVHHYDVTARTLFTARLTVTDDDGPDQHQDDRVHRVAGGHAAV